MAVRTTGSREWLLPERDAGGVRTVQVDEGSGTLSLIFDDDAMLSLPTCELERVEHAPEGERRQLILVRKDGGRAVLNRFGMSRSEADRLAAQITRAIEGANAASTAAHPLGVRDALEGADAFEKEKPSAGGYRDSGVPQREVIRWRPASLAHFKRANFETADIPLEVFALIPVAVATFMLGSLTRSAPVSAVVFAVGLVLVVQVMRRVPKVTAIALDGDALELRSTHWLLKGNRSVLLRQIARVELVPHFTSPLSDYSGGALRLLGHAGETLAEVPVALSPRDRLRLFTALSRHVEAKRAELGQHEAARSLPAGPSSGD